MWSLFNLTGPNGFGGLGFTMLQLFSVTMGSVDYLLIQDYANGIGLNASLGSVDSSQSSIIKTVNVGLVIYTVFAVVVGIMLLNLLVARMRGIHDRIELKSKQEWGYMMSDVTEQYLSLIHI